MEMEGEGPDPLEAPESAILYYFFETEAGLDDLIIIEGYLEELTGFRILDFESFSQVITFAWQVVSVVAKKHNFDAFELFNSKKIWELLLQSQSIKIEFPEKP